MILWLFIVDVVVSIVSVLNLVERWENRNYEEGKALAAIDWIHGHKLSFYWGY